MLFNSLLRSLQLKHLEKMRFKILCGLLLFSWLSGTLSACCSGHVAKEALNLKPPPGMPTSLYFRTRTQTFNAKYNFVLKDNRIWYQQRAQSSAPWVLLSRTGQPEGCDVVQFPPPQKLVSISADGIHLQALSKQGVLYRSTNVMGDLKSGFSWTDKWGWPAAGGPGLQSPFGATLKWDVSDSFPFHLKTYQDGNGTTHDIGLGVAHIYALGPQGKKIYFNDWWLPADWSRQACGPRRGTFKAITMSTSASTLFLINAYGEMYTRMHDFDISGENPLLTYTFYSRTPPKHVRKLPMPDWRKQPVLPPTQITSTITILQNGEGNSARELRVEGVKNGKTGYYTKAIFAKTWSFKETGHTLLQPFLKERPKKQPVPDARNSEETTLTGTLKKDGEKEALQIEIRGFHVVCSPAELRIQYKGKWIQTQGKDLVWTLHHVHTMVTHRRKREFWTSGKVADIRVGLITPTLDSIDDPDARKILQRFFSGIPVINFSGTATQKSMQLKELTRGELFRADDSEKGISMRFTLQAQTQSN